MPNLTLTSGQITAADQLSVELVQAVEIPPSYCCAGQPRRAPTKTPAASGRRGSASGVRDSADTPTYDEENDAKHAATLSRSDNDVIPVLGVSRHAEGR